MSSQIQRAQALRAESQRKQTESLKAHKQMLDAEFEVRVEREVQRRINVIMGNLVTKCVEELDQPVLPPLGRKKTKV